jgi:hypothetical protein
MMLIGIGTGDVSEALDERAGVHLDGPLQMRELDRPELCVCLGMVKALLMGTRQGKSTRLLRVLSRSCCCLRVFRSGQPRREGTG